jgi:hypothetical protein
MQELVNQVGTNGIDFDDGLKPSEGTQGEARHTLSLPSDVREFLSVGHPGSQNFPKRGTTSIRGLVPIAEKLGWPASGIFFDMQNGLLGPS